MGITYPRQYQTDRVESLLRSCDDYEAGHVTLAGKRRSDIFSIGSACGSESSWIRLWCELSELLVPLFYTLRSTKPDPAHADWRTMQRNAFDFAGSTSRAIHKGLDEAYRRIPGSSARGRQILSDILSAVEELVLELDKRLFVGATVVEDGGALTEEEVEQSRTLIEIFRSIVLLDVASILDKSSPRPPGQWAHKPKSEIVKRVWLRGMEDDGAPIRSFAGILLLTRAIAGAISTDSGIAATIDDNDPFSIMSRDPGGVPRGIARIFSDGEWILRHRTDVAKQYDYHDTGIRDPGTTELDRLGFQYVFDGGGNQRSFVVLAPTSSGKSRLGQLAVIEAIYRARRDGRFGRILVLVPTKALVNQTSRDLRLLFAEDEESAGWIVLEGSRDYPQFDDRIRNGRFDVAVCIPEKVSVLLRIGMSLSETSLVLVDELQHLLDPSRGLALEMLMIELMRAYPHIRWIGLSASLAEETRRMVEEWFVRNNSDVLVYRAKYRPVPVMLAAIDGERFIEHSPDSENSVRRGTRGVPSASVRRISELNIRERTTKSWAVRYARTLSVLCNLIGSADSGEISGIAELPSVLVFVNSRRAAENLPVALQTVATLTGILPPTNPGAVPYVDNRFTAFDPRPGEYRRPPDELLTDLELTPPGTIRRHVTAALTSGIGFHTSTLDGHARETVEDGFRQGYIRVLFATDTLKLGVNLPADIVVNADLLLNTGSGQRLLDKDAVIQRFGRAGRLGVSRGRRGLGYLVVPESLRIRDPDAFHIGVDERIALTGSAEGTCTEVVSAATSLEGAFHGYLSNLDGGASYVALTNDLWFSDALVRLVCESPNLAMPAEGLAVRARELFCNSFAGVTGRTYPEGVLSRIEAAGALRTLSDGTIRVTRLGRIAAGNALGLSAALDVKEIALAASAGAGPFTILYLACMCDAARGASFQMLCDGRMSPGERKQILQVAAKLGRVKRGPMETAAFFRLRENGDDLFGTGASADELRVMLAQAPDTLLRSGGMTDEQLTAIWRATALCHWWAGTPVTYIETMIDSAKWRVDESDLRQVAEGAANLIAGASDYLGTAPADLTFRSLLVFSQEVEIGLPNVLTSLVRTNDRSMHRERLIGLLPNLLDPTLRWDHLVDILDVYAREQEGMPNGGPSGWRPLTPKHIRKITGYLEEQESLFREAAFTVPAAYADRRLPISGPTMSERLLSFQRGNGIQDVGELFEEFNFESIDVLPPIGNPEAMSHGVRVRLLSGPHVDVYVAGSSVDHALVDRAVAGLKDGGNAVIVATTGATLGVLTHSRFLTTPCAVVEPSLLLEMIARVAEDFTIKSDFDWVPGGFDQVGASELLARMIVNNAPVLTRQDLEGRLVHDKLVAEESSAL